MENQKDTLNWDITALQDTIMSPGASTKKNAMEVDKLKKKLGDAKGQLANVQGQLDKITELQQARDQAQKDYSELKPKYDANMRRLQAMLNDESLQEFHGTIINALGEILPPSSITYSLAHSAISAPPETKRLIFDLLSLSFKTNRANAEAGLLDRFLVPHDPDMAAFFLLKIAEESPRTPEPGGITAAQRTRFENKVLDHLLRETWHGNAHAAEMLVRRMILPRETKSGSRKPESESFRRGALRSITALLSETHIDAEDRNNLLAAVVNAMLRVLEHDKLVRNGGELTLAAHRRDTDTACKKFIEAVLKQGRAVSASTKNPGPLSLAVEACRMLYQCEALPLKYAVKEKMNSSYRKDFGGALLSVFTVPEWGSS
ncbi:MAG: hypothetical protein Q7T16_04930 [Candidatus Burarchaeum sp.]|nr:hypothetical protein [Candidatus Burarchaeum sp.]MDO8339974.1 hypothetical protein [Candidatus Burarchaeum sp.]